MSENDIKKAARHCATEELCDGCPLSGYPMSFCAEKFAHYILTDKENEPAPAATETSSEVSSDDTRELTLLDDNTLLDICQEKLEKIAEIAHADYPDDYITGYIEVVKDSIKELRGGHNNG